MGNLFCYYEEDYESNQTDSTFKIHMTSINDEAIQKLNQIPSPLQKEFINFHEDIVQKLIAKCDEPIKINRHSIPPKIISEKGNQGQKIEFYQKIKERSHNNQDSFFSQLIQEYFMFITKTLSLNSKTITVSTLPSKDKSDSNAYDIQDGSYCISTDQQHPKLKGPRSKWTVELVIHQMNYIFLLIRSILYKGLGQILYDYFGGDADNFPAVELFVNRVVQHHLLGKGSPLKDIYFCLIQSYYEEADKSIMRQSLYPEIATVVDQHTFDISSQLLPLHTEFKGNVSNLSKDSFLQSSTGTQKQYDCYDSSIKSCQKQQKEMADFIAKSQIIADKTNIPYAQTFPLLVRLITTTKPWKKFLLIEKFEKLIARIFLENRSEHKLEKYEEIFSAEDSKSEIYIFIIHQYCTKYPKSNYIDILYTHLRVMSDFDGLLHRDIKYIFCPFFLRFFSVIELYIQYLDQQKILNQ